MEKLLSTVIQLKASDIHISVGQPPVVRHHGRMRKLDAKVLDSDDTTALMKSITPDRCQQELQEKGGCDFAIEFTDGVRFRCSIFKQKGTIGMVLRRIPSQFLSFEQIGMPEAIRSLIVKQREIGVDVPDFKEGIRRALRMDPDIILVGEMRDLATIHAAIEAAETGHVVFGTLHTSGASSTINRIIDVFPKEQQDQVRTQLSTALIGVLSQALMPKKPDGLVAAYEMMVVTPAIRNLIRENKVYRIDSSIQTGRKHGMFLLDESLFKLWREGMVDKEE